MNLQQAQQLGHQCAEACADKAERVSAFDTEAAGEAMLTKLAFHPDGLPGEKLTSFCRDELKMRPHNDKAFGGVILRLANRGLIKKVGYAERTKGHGSPGPIWTLAGKEVA